MLLLFVLVFLCAVLFAMSPIKRSSAGEPCFEEKHPVILPRESSHRSTGVSCSPFHITRKGEGHAGTPQDKVLGTSKPVLDEEDTEELRGVQKIQRETTESRGGSLTRRQEYPESSVNCCGHTLCQTSLRKICRKGDEDVHYNLHMRSNQSCAPGSPAQHVDGQLHGSLSKVCDSEENVLCGVQ